MPVNLNIILLSNSHNFGYYANSFYQPDLRKQSVTDDYCMLLIKWLLTLAIQQKAFDTISVAKTYNCKKLLNVIFTSFKLK